jgi:hypothetical protein
MGPVGSGQPGWGWAGGSSWRLEVVPREGPRPRAEVRSPITNEVEVGHSRVRFNGLTKRSDSGATSKFRLKKTHSTSDNGQHPAYHIPPTTTARGARCCCRCRPGVGAGGLAACAQAKAQVRRSTRDPRHDAWPYDDDDVGDHCALQAPICRNAITQVRHSLLF